MKSGSMVETVLENLPAAVFAKDASDDFRFVLWNKKQEEITSIKASRAIGKDDYDLFSEESANYFRSIDKAVVKRDELLSVPDEIIETGHRGEVHLRTVKIPIHDESNGRRLVVGISEDITEQVKARAKLEKVNRDLVVANDELQETQMQIIQLEKLESIGRLAAGVAHEVKNPLALLLLGVDYLSQGIDPDDPNINVILEEMRQAIERADKIVRGLVDFSSQRALTREKVDLRELIDQVLLLLRHELTRTSTQVELEFDEDMPEISLDLSKFEQVLINLVLNAIHAMEKAEVPLLIIRAHLDVARSVTKDQGARSYDVLRDGDEIVVLEIVDCGTGVEKAQLSRVFDPFFTTKATGVGTGLGLSVSKKIVALHRGTLTLRNRESGRGAVARLILPIRTESKDTDPISPEALGLTNLP